VDYTLLPDLVDEVAIPRDGTLSRVVYKDDNLRLVLFGFDTGQELTEHTASVPAIIQLISGHMTATLGGDTVPLHPGSWLHMPAHLPHSVFAVEPSVMLLTMLRTPAND
jgi:quercetin dioxygenase-like cupin family protein